MENKTEKWIIIINPKSGKRKFRQQLSYLFTILNKSGIKFEYRLTKFVGHATKIAKLFVEKDFTNFLIVGGDGTLSEVVNGILSAKIEDFTAIKIALIPRGTGNDWARYWGLTNDYKNSINVFLKAKVQKIDIGIIDYELELEKHTHYFINSVGFGLDAKVVKIAHHLKKMIGSHSFLYTLALVSAVFTYRAQKIRIQTDNDTLIEFIFTMNIGNGSFSGGGMRQTPNALPYDGLLDIMFAKKPTLFDVFNALGKLFNGKLLEHRMINSFQTKNMEISCSKNTIFEADGILVNATSPLKISTLPAAIQMIVP